MNAPLGITTNVPAGQEATGVYESATGIPVSVESGPYYPEGGDILVSPLPVVIVESGTTFTDSLGNVQRALAVNGIPE